MILRSTIIRKQFKHPPKSDKDEGNHIDLNTQGRYRGTTIEWGRQGDTDEIRDGKHNPGKQREETLET